MVWFIVIFFPHSKYILPCSLLSVGMFTGFLQSFWVWGLFMLFGIAHYRVVLILALHFWHDLKFQQGFQSLFLWQKTQRKAIRRMNSSLVNGPQVSVMSLFFENLFYFCNHLRLQFSIYGILWGHKFQWLTFCNSERESLVTDTPNNILMASFYWKL